jgi:KaiC/GvpD/RAD55 family RecA-like ATPase
MNEPQSDNPDRLPPHDLPAEMGVLGCCLLDPVAALPDAQSRLGTDEVFFDLRNAEIWHALTFLKSKCIPIDVITLRTELVSRNRFDNVGGFQYLEQLQAVVPSAANLPEYLDIVWEKYLARQLIAKNIQQVGAVFETSGLSESFIVRMAEQHARWNALLARGVVTPKNLCAPADFGDAYYNVWFKRVLEDYGWELPFKFPMRIRPSELTLFTGDNGAGKSSMLGQIAIVCGKQFEQGEKIVIASMEVPPEITLWIMARQLLGVGKLEENDANLRLITKALAWLNERVLIYNFLGITDWRELLNTFIYAREHLKGAVFIVDSVMRIGIPDDDYAMQGLVAMQFADFAVKRGAHVFLVVHENKGEGRAKDRVRGSKQWTDNAHNVVAVKRNEAKAEKLEEWKQQLLAKEITKEEFDKKRDGVRGLWDTKFILNKQRWPGSQQNASRWLFFNFESLQFHEYPDDGNIDFML